MKMLVITIPNDRFKFDVYQNKRGKTSCEGRIYYQSFFASSKHSLPKVKLDLTVDEVIVMPPSDRRIFHNYTDDPPDGNFIKCYSFEELFAEKVRALGERGRPRDLYDVINLFRNDQLPSSTVIRDILSKKCEFKNISIPTLDIINIYELDLEGNWEPMLGHQLPALPSLEVYWDALPDFFSWLEQVEEVKRVTLDYVPGEGETFRPVYGRLGLKTIRGGSLEIIRFAAGNRLCVNLRYQGTTRQIEPYSLRRTPAGNVLLYAIKSQTNEIRSYRIDRIEGASITNQVFIPKFQIELSPSGPLSASTSRGSSTNLGLPTRVRKTTTRRL